MLQRGALLWLAALAGCISFGTGTGGGGDDDSQSSSNLEPIADYEVDAERTLSSCGEGSMTLAPVWSFQITLREDEAQTEIWWDAGGEPTPGELDGHAFAFTSAVAVDMRSPETYDDWLPPCVIQRVDTVRGSFDDPAARDTWTGTMGYHFEPVAGSDCTDLLTGDARVLTQLPCDATYAVRAHALGDVRPMLEGGGGAGGAGGADAGGGGASGG